MVSKSQTLYFLHGACYKLAVLTDRLANSIQCSQHRALGLGGVRKELKDSPGHAFPAPRFS